GRSSAGRAPSDDRETVGRGREAAVAGFVASHRGPRNGHVRMWPRFDQGAGPRSGETLAIKPRSVPGPMTDTADPTTDTKTAAPAFDAERRATELAILDALRAVVDPEIGMNVVELALI